MKEFLKVLMVIFGVLSLVFFALWAIVTDSDGKWDWVSEPGWFTVFLGFCLGGLILSIIIYMFPGERGLPLESIGPGTYPKSRIIGETKHSVLFILGTEKSDPTYVKMPKSDFHPVPDPEGNVLKVEKMKGHDIKGRKVKVRIMSFKKS